MSQTIPCEACQGDGKVDYTTGTRLRDCRICKGSGVITLTDAEYTELQKQKGII